MSPRRYQKPSSERRCWLATGCPSSATSSTLRVPARWRLLPKNGAMYVITPPFSTIRSSHPQRTTFTQNIQSATVDASTCRSHGINGLIIPVWSQTMELISSAESSVCLIRAAGREHRRSGVGKPTATPRHATAGAGHERN